MAWMAVWWMTEAVPLSVTALLPFVVLPLAGVSNAEKTASTYYSPILFLLLVQPNHPDAMTPAALLQFPLELPPLLLTLMLLGNGRAGRVLRWRRAWGPWPMAPISRGRSAIPPMPAGSTACAQGSAPKRSPRRWPPQPRDPVR